MIANVAHRTDYIYLAERYDTTWRPAAQLGLAVALQWRADAKRL